MKMTLRFLTFLFVLNICGTWSAVAEESGTNTGDTEVINFVLPGDFQDVLKQAKERNRCFLIKGIAFGVDKLGAKCATKGLW